MTRICPSCNKTLGSYDYYFCSSCGEKLPPQLVNAEGVHVRKIPYIDIVEKKNSSNALAETLTILGETKGIFSYLIILLGIGALVGIGIFLYQTVMKPLTPMKTNISQEELNKASEMNIPQVEEETTADTDQETSQDMEETSIEETSGIFGTHEMYSYFPSDSLLVGEFFSYEDLQTNFEAIELDENIQSLLGTHFGYVIGEVTIEDSEESQLSMGIILSLGDVDQEEALSEITDYVGTEYTVRILSDLIIVTDTVELYDSIEDSRLGLKKTMDITPAFINVSNSLPTQGQGFIYLTTELDILEEYLGEELFSSLKEKDQNYLIL